MRKYIFTDSERERLEAWLNGEEEDSETRKLFVNVRRSLNTLRREVELLSQVARRLSKEERLLGRVRLREDPALRLQPGGSESTLRRRETSTSTSSS
jgi:hypothetical protein